MWFSDNGHRTLNNRACINEALHLQFDKKAHGNREVKTHHSQNYPAESGLVMRVSSELFIRLSIKFHRIIWSVFLSPKTTTVRGPVYAIETPHARC